MNVFPGITDLAHGFTDDRHFRGNKPAYQHGDEQNKHATGNGRRVVIPMAFTMASKPLPCADQNRKDAEI